ncbi:diguanylate cyclase [Legionella quinlivanii]|uniref:diguanylate cyclase n=1 Tax=Legionella quinlivanii TaxID=45073 RepID=UPI00224324B9|nr:diguanylate cyclase [Legionella quinlivanii]MCW8452170.1 diguanylate cyclase [Legionella quinlivanii]
MKGKPVSSFLHNLQLSRGILNFVFIAALICLLIINVYSYYQLRALVKANHWVIHTYQVIQSIDSSLYSVVDIESRQRAYLLRGNEQFLADVEPIKKQLTADIEQLVILTKDNPGQKLRVQRFVDSVNKRMELLSRILQFKLSNKLDTPEGLEQLNLSQNLSNRVKDLGQEIKSVEMVLLTERNNSAISQSKVFSSILIVGGTISILFLIIAFALANLELLTRRRAEQHNFNTQTRLRKIIESASDMIAALDKNLQFIIFNEAYQQEFKQLFGKNLTLGMSIDEAFEGIADEKRAISAQWKDSLQNHEKLLRAELKVKDDKYTYEMSSSLIQNDNNEVNGVVHSVRNITQRIKEHTELQLSYEKLTAGMLELQNKNIEITLLVEMSDIMLACSTLEELSAVMSKYSQRLLSFVNGGYLFIMHPSKNYLEKASSWGEPHDQDQTFVPDQCWAIRLGRIHQVNDPEKELVCSHIQLKEHGDRGLLCVPLMAQNDIYGLLYMEAKTDTPLLIDENKRLLITAFAELTALALANVRLRENLRHQSIRDPLTGLYNRRYLEDFMFKQLHQAQRSNSPFAILMIDLDHFKKINDTYGHEAGDVVLKEFGHILQENIRLGDIAARYGGEEFIVMFYDIHLDDAKMRAEAIRAAINKTPLKYGAQQIGQVTASIGLSMYPKDGKTTADLIEAADKALYSAKNNGRNQVVVFGKSENGKLPRSVAEPKQIASKH